jgi:hypothetical protein
MSLACLRLLPGANPFHREMPLVQEGLRKLIHDQLVRGSFLCRLCSLLLRYGRDNEENAGEERGR